MSDTTELLKEALRQGGCAPPEIALELLLAVLDEGIGRNFMLNRVPWGMSREEQMREDPLFREHSHYVTVDVGQGIIFQHVTPGMFLLEYIGIPKKIIYEPLDESIEAGNRYGTVRRRYIDPEMTDFRLSYKIDHALFHGLFYTASETDIIDRRFNEKAKRGGFGHVMVLRRYDNFELYTHTDRIIDSPLDI